MYLALPEEAAERSVGFGTLPDRFSRHIFVALDCFLIDGGILPVYRKGIVDRISIAFLALYTIVRPLSAIFLVLSHFVGTSMGCGGRLRCFNVT